MRKKSLIIISVFLVLFTSPLFANGAGESSLVEKMTELVFQIGIILFAAKLGGYLMKKINMPSVLGELMIGIIIGPYLLGGLPFFGFQHGLFPLVNPEFPVTPELYAFSTVASIILLFHSGLETDLSLFLRFSVKGAVIGIGGVVVSFISGAWAGSLITGLPMTAPVNLFLGVISTATSVGITARILSEQRKMDSPEGVTVLAAAVIDDVLGIIILAIVLGIVSVMTGHGGTVHWGSIGFIALKAIGVWLGFTVVGLLFARKIGNSLKIFNSETSIAIMSLGLALILSGLFEKAGLAMIIGAYVMGLTLSRTDLSFIIQEKIHPLQEFFVPIFFCVMGMLVDVSVVLKPEVLMAGALFSLVGILSKMIGCGIPSLFLNFNLLGASRIGVGMVPRGEVALIMAGIGISAGILNPSQFGVAVLMTLMTTLIPPPILTLLLKKEGMGTRTEMKGTKTVVNDFDFPSHELMHLALSRVVGALRAEGFYLHDMELDHHIYQIRKDDVFLTIHEYSDSFEVVSDPEDVFYIKTVVYESLLEVNNTIESLKTMARPGELKKELAADDNTRVQNNFFKEISEHCIIMDLKGNDKNGILYEMVDRMDNDGKLLDYADCLQSVLDREASMSTGMQNGIAIPHGKSDGVRELVVSIGLKKEGIDFNSLDGLPTKVFIMTLSPKKNTGPHIQFLSSISAILNKPHFIEDLLACSDPASLKELLVREAKEKA
ncbi:cation:proton antiporter [Oceanispirochaeta sp.]|uniref:cation:proton antiporter domain-containing protein n=1 Tax=Oceanispirochaeta sp. TaxID=2035350 RepID=UPI002639545E|nr:cation:proton antiporter [Oceanispirochaeta sp.]MDA3956671.1 cation:proton antiporter [Oceanispirochaeta sp.]